MGIRLFLLAVFEFCNVIGLLLFDFGRGIRLLFYCEVTRFLGEVILLGFRELIGLFLGEHIFCLFLGEIVGCFLGEIVG